MGQLSSGQGQSAGSSPRQPETELSRFALSQALEEMAAAERDIAVVAADLGLDPARNRMPLGIDAQVHRGFAPAFAYRLQLDQRIGEREKRSAAFEQLALEVGAKAIAEHRDLQIVGHSSELKHVLAGEELSFVHQHAIKLALLQFFGHCIEQVDVGRIAVRRR